VRPGDQHAGRHDGADVGQLEQLRGVLLDQRSDVCPVAGEVTVEGAHAPGQPDCLAAAGPGRGVLVTVTPCCDRGDLPRCEWLAGIDPGTS